MGLGMRNAFLHAALHVLLGWERLDALLISGNHQASPLSQRSTVFHSGGKIHYPRQPGRTLVLIQRSKHFKGPGRGLCELHHRLPLNPGRLSGKRDDGHLHHPVVICVRKLKKRTGSCSVLR